MKRLSTKSLIINTFSKRYASLNEQDVRLTSIAGYTASGNMAQLARTWKELPQNEHALGAEVILQNSVYSGIPRTLMALMTVCEIGMKDRIIVDPYPSNKNKYADWEAKGEQTSRLFYGYKYKRVLTRCKMLHPAFGRWVQGFMYGRVLSRPGLSPKVRALCELASMGGNLVLPQFRSGIMMALTSGASVEEVKAVLDMTQRIWGHQEQTVVDALWRDISINGWGNDDESLVQQNSGLVPGEKLKEDWSHLRRPEDVLVPNWRHPNVLSLRSIKDLPDRTRILALLSGNIVAGNLSRAQIDWSYLLPDQHRMGMEIALQTVGLGGFHRCHNALRALHSIGVSQDAINIKREESVDETEFGANAERILEQKYSHFYESFRQSIFIMHPDLFTWIWEFLYGAVFARDCPGLSLAERELAAISGIGSTSFSQLRFHMRGALNCGATLEQIRGVLDQTAIVWGRPSQTFVDGYWLDFYKDERALSKAHSQHKY